MLRSSTSTDALAETANIVSILSAQIIAEACPLSEEQAHFFYGEFFDEVCKRAGNAEPSNANVQEAVAELMRRLVDLLAAELKMKTSRSLALAEKMRHVLDPGAKFHKHAFQKPSGGSSATGQAQASAGDTENGRVVDMNEDEREWRLSLEKGKTVDVLKQDLKTKS